MTTVSKRAAFAAAVLVLAIDVSEAVSVIPGGVGYGMSTPAGRGGQVIRVTNLNSSGAGSLKACVDADGPRVCVFEVSGNINLSEMLSITKPYITVAGQTAPSPGITLRGNKLRVATSDVLIQHIRIRSGDGADIVDASTSGPVGVSNARSSFKNVVLDHVSLSWGIDENLDVYNGYSNVTVRHSIISEALYDSLHPKGPHSMAALIGDGGNNVSMLSNLIAHQRGRNPRVLARNFILANNVIYDYGAMGLDMTMPGDSSPLLHSIVGNLFIKGPSSSGNVMPITLQTKGSGSAGDSRVYLSGNRSLDHSTTNQWQLVNNQLTSTPSASSPPSWIDGLSAASAITSDVLNMVLANVGARPADRDSVDVRIINETRERRGSIINCVAADGSARCQKNAGGWPKLAQNYRKLTIPASPSADDDKDGYTNLEEWLHQMAYEVEGKDIRRPEAPELVRVE